MKKRWVSVVLVISMLAAGVMTGCGGEKKTEENKTEGGSEEKQVLTLMGVGTSSEQTYVDLMEDLAEEFNNTNEYNAEIQIEWYENEQYKTKLPTLMTQNEAGDIFFSWTSGWLQPYVENGKVYSISEAMEKDPEWKDRFYAGMLDGTTFDDQIYALPSTQSLYVVYYNKGIFSDLGLSEPETWDEFIEITKTLEQNDIVPVAIGGQEGWIAGFHMNLLANGLYGKALTDDMVDGKINWEDERFAEAGELFQDIGNSGIYNDGFLGLDYNGSRELFLSGKAAMYPMGTWDTSAIMDSFGGDITKVGAFILPAVNAENQNVTLSQTDKIYAISETCKNKEAACAFLKRLTDPDVQGRLVAEIGAIPVSEAKYDEAAVDDLTKKILEKLPDLTTTLPLSLIFGATGEEYNNIAVSIAGGNDGKEQLKALQEYAANAVE